MRRSLEMLGLSVLVLVVATMNGRVTAAEDEKAVTGKVDKVTLYRGQALVTRSVSIDAPKGAVELVVSQLPESVIPDSLYAEGDEGVEIRAVRFRARAVGQEPREDLRKLDLQIEETTADLARIGQMKKLATKRMEFLDKLEQFVAPTAKTELSQGVLNAASLEQITEFSFTQREKAVMDLLKNTQDEKTTRRKLALLQRQRQELATGSSRTIREAVLFLDKAVAGAVNLKLNYLVAKCGWTPSYNFRARSDGGEVKIEYNAVVRQMSGEDWNGVQLTLSTASPALSAKGPGLAPFRVVLAPHRNSQGQQAPNQSASDVAQQLSSIKGRREQALEQQLRAQDLRGNRDSSWAVNAVANDYQVLELTSGAGANVLLTNKSRASVDVNGPSLRYHLDGKVSMASRSDQQIVRIMQADLESELYHVATPVLTNYVYREAELVNASNEDLLAGTVNVYLGGRFVGRGEIGTVARGQTFVMGFGADPQLRTRRELVTKDDKVQGGNRELSFEYRLVVENYKDEVVPVRVVDRLPFTDREAEVRVTLGEMEDKLSENAFYLRRERPKGILRWDVDVPAGAAGETARVVNYDYTVEFDRNMSIINPALAQAGQPSDNLKLQQEEFESLEDFRQYKE